MWEDGMCVWNNSMYPRCHFVWTTALQSYVSLKNSFLNRQQKLLFQVSWQQWTSNDCQTLLNSRRHIPMFCSRTLWSRMGHIGNGCLSWKRFLVPVTKLVQTTLKHFQGALKQQVCRPESSTLPQRLDMKRATPCMSLRTLISAQWRNSQKITYQTCPCHWLRTTLMDIKCDILSSTVSAEASKSPTESL